MMPRGGARPRGVVTTIAKPATATTTTQQGAPEPPTESVTAKKASEAKAPVPPKDPPKGPRTGPLKLRK